MVPGPSPNEMASAKFYKLIEDYSFDEERVNLFKAAFEFEAFLPKSVEKIRKHVVEYFKFFAGVKAGKYRGHQNPVFQREALQEMLQRASIEFHKQLLEDLIAEGGIF